jgi:serine/threonine-protein kinase ATR
MVDAFGPVGTDGIYASSLKDALGTLRQNRDTLLSVLEPFVTDPVIDWRRSRTQQKSQMDSEVQNKAVQSIQTIKERLQGIVTLKNPNKKKVKQGKVPSMSEETEGKAHSIPLSVDGQVDKLIAEATSSENLVQLYVGWMPWL